METLIARFIQSVELSFAVDLLKEKCARQTIPVEFSKPICFKIQVYIIALLLTLYGGAYSN